jgi:hypothetical protein
MRNAPREIDLPANLIAGIEFKRSSHFNIDGDRIPYYVQRRTGSPAGFLENFKTLKSQFLSRPIELTPLKHVLVEWPESHQRPTRLPPSIEPKPCGVSLQEIDTADNRYCRGRGTQHWLTVQDGDIRDPQNGQSSDRFLKLAFQAGELLRDIGPKAEAAFYGNKQILYVADSRSRWLLALHSILQPVRNQWWYSEISDGCEIPVTKCLDRPFSEEIVHSEYAILDDVDLQSALAIDQIIATMGELSRGRKQRTRPKSSDTPKDWEIDAVRTILKDRHSDMTRDAIQAQLQAQRGKGFGNSKITRILAILRTSHEYTG